MVLQCRPDPNERYRYQVFFQTNTSASTRTLAGFQVYDYNLTYPTNASFVILDPTDFNQTLNASTPLPWFTAVFDTTIEIGKHQYPDEMIYIPGFSMVRFLFFVFV